MNSGGRFTKKDRDSKPVLVERTKGIDGKKPEKTKKKVIENES